MVNKTAGMYVRRGKRSAQIYHTSAWQRARANFLKSNPYCRFCRQRGKRVRASVVDHIQPHRGDPMKFWNQKNWQPLCKLCHDVDKGRLDRYHKQIDETFNAKYKVDEDGWITGIRT